MSFFFFTAVTVLFGVHNFSSSKMNSSKNAFQDSRILSAAAQFTDSKIIKAKTLKVRFKCKKKIEEIKKKAECVCVKYCTSSRDVKMTSRITL